MVMGHAPISHKVKHQDELRGITAKLIKIEKLEVTVYSNNFGTLIGPADLLWM